MFPASFVRRKGQCKATGQYVFNAECAEDLSVYPGETLFLAEIIDENWVCIENQRGLRGNVPRNFLSAIVVETEESRDPATGLFSNGFGTTTSMNSTKYQQSNQTHAKSSSGIDSFGLNNELPPSASFIQTEHSTNNIHTSASSTQSNSASSPQNHNVTKSSAAPMKAFQPNNYSATSSFGDTFSSNSATTSNSNFGSGGLGMRRAVSQYFPPSDESSGGINTDFLSAWDDDMLEKKDNSVSKRSSGIFGGSGGSLNKSASHSDVRQLGKGKGCSKRESAIEELVGTEKSFCRDVELFLEVFAPSDYHWTALKVDYRSICGNIAQARDFLFYELSKAVLVLIVCPTDPIRNFRPFDRYHQAALSHRSASPLLKKVDSLFFENNFPIFFSLFILANHENFTHRACMFIAVNTVLKNQNNQDFRG